MQWGPAASERLVAQAEAYATGTVTASVAIIRSRDLEVQDRIEKTLYRIFATEDKPMIEAQQKMLGNNDLMHLNPVLLPTDKAAVLMRRHLADLIQKENAH